MARRYGGRSTSLAWVRLPHLGAVPSLRDGASVASLPSCHKNQQSWLAGSTIGRGCSTFNREIQRRQVFNPSFKRTTAIAGTVSLMEWLSLTIGAVVGAIASCGACTLDPGSLLEAVKPELARH